MQTGIRSAPSLIVICLGIQLLLHAVKAQESWFAYPGLFGGFNGYVTQGPPPAPAWENNPFDPQSQAGISNQLNQGGFIDPNGHSGFMPSHNQVGLNMQPNHMSNTHGFVNQGLVDHQTGLLDQSNPYPQQWPVDIQSPSNQAVRGQSEGVPVPQQAIPSSSPPPDPVNASLANSKDHWSSNAHAADQQSPYLNVDQNTWQAPGPPPLNNAQTSQQQWQGTGNPNSDLAHSTDQQTFGQTFNLNHQELPTQHETGSLHANAQDNISLNTSHPGSQSEIDSSTVRHYLMPPGGQNVNTWPVVPNGAYPMRPGAKAEWINYLREAAMRFYGRYPAYPQPFWNKVLRHQSRSMGTNIHPQHQQNWVSKSTVKATKQDTVSKQDTQTSLTNEQLSVNPLYQSGQSQSNGSDPPDVTKSQSGRHSPSKNFSSSAPNSTPDITTARSITSLEVTLSPPSSQVTATSDTSYDALSTLTPHKNMTNDELHKIIRILLIPHKMKRISKNIKITSTRNHHQAPADTKHSQRASPVSQTGPQRRPVSEMHIKMVNYAPHLPHRIAPSSTGLSAVNAHPSLSNIQPQSVSEIHVKLVNYDQKIVDTFNSQISSPRMRGAQPKWISTATQGGRHISSPKEIPTKTTPNSGKLHVPQHTSAQRHSTLPSSTQGNQYPKEHVKNHQKGVVRHAQMLHHVMSNLQREMNRFQGSVRHSRHSSAHKGGVPVTRELTKPTNNSEILHPEPLSLSPENSTTRKAESTKLTVPDESNASGVQNKASVFIPLTLSKNPQTTTFHTAIDLKLNRTGTLTAVTESQDLNLPLVPDIFTNLKTSVDVTSATSSSSPASPPTSILNVESTTVSTAPTVLTPSPYNVENQQKTVSETTELKIKVISPALLIGEPGTEKTSKQSLLDKTTSYLGSNSGMQKMNLSAFYASQRQLRNSLQTTTRESVVVTDAGKHMLVPEVLTTSAPKLYESPTEAPTPKPVTVANMITTEISVQTEAVNQEVMNQQLNNQLAEQLGKLEKLHHKQQLINQQQTLKDQHARLKKQRDLLQQQLRTLQKLRGSEQGTSLAVPESPAGLAALLSGLQMTF